MNTDILPQPPFKTKATSAISAFGYMVNHEEKIVRQRRIHVPNVSVSKALDWFSEMGYEIQLLNVVK